MTEPQTITRNAGLQDLVGILRANHARKLDIVAPVSQIKADAGRLVVAGAGTEITEEGVTTQDGIYLPTAICDDGLADRLGIPPGYLNRLRHKHIDLYDSNVNGWLTHLDNGHKQFLVRAFRDDKDPNGGVARAFLSDSYKPIDDLDVLMTALEGIKTAGVPVDIAACDLTDRRMYVRVVCEQIAVNAEALVRDYRYGGRTGKDFPLVFAGFEISNSEVGHGAFSIAPRLVVQVCSNGMTRRADAFRAQHLGTKLEAGTINWSDATQQKNLELIKSKTVDAVRTFLSKEYVQKHIDSLAEAADVPVKSAVDTIKHVATTLRYGESVQNEILAQFIGGGMLTAGGVMHAATAAAQELSDADLAADIEADSWRVLELAAAFAARS